MKEDIFYLGFVGFLVGAFFTTILAFNSTVIPNNYLNNSAYKIDTLYINNTEHVYMYKFVKIKK